LLGKMTILGYVQDNFELRQFQLASCKLTVRVF
jgi:hypothetical protein